MYVHTYMHIFSTSTYISSIFLQPEQSETSQPYVEGISTARRSRASKLNDAMFILLRFPFPDAAQSQSVQITFLVTCRPLLDDLSIHFVSLQSQEEEEEEQQLQTFISRKFTISSHPFKAKSALRPLNWDQLVWFAKAGRSFLFCKIELKKQFLFFKYSFCVFEFFFSILFKGSFKKYLFVFNLILQVV